MASGSPLRGSRIGAGPTGEFQRGELIARHRLDFYCTNGHVTWLSFAQDADLPQQWDCPRCGLPAGRDEHAPPRASHIEPYKTHLAYVKERRSDEDGEALLAEALARVTHRRAPRP